MLLIYFVFELKWRKVERYGEWSIFKWRDRNAAGLYHTLTKLSIPKYQILLSKYPNTVSKYAKYPHIKHNKISPIWDKIFEDRNVIFKNMSHIWGNISEGS